MGCAWRLVIDIIDTGSLQPIAEFLGSFGTLFRTDAQEKDMNFVVECFAVFKCSVVSSVNIRQINAACSTETAYISKFV